MRLISVEAPNKWGLFSYSCVRPALVAGPAKSKQKYHY